MSHRKIAVIGLGYVGLPVAAAFARAGDPVVGFDIDQTRIRELRAGQDRTRELDSCDLQLPSLSFTSDAAALRASDFFIVTVPTPIDGARRPDLGAMFEASRLVGGRTQERRHSRLRIDRLSRRSRRGMRADPRATLRP